MLSTPSSTWSIRHRTRTLTSALLLAVLASCVTALADHASLPAFASPRDPTGQTSASRTPGVTVTLVTGDQVRLSRLGDGYAVTPTAGPGREGIAFGTRRYGNSIWVIPSDAVAAIASGRLDRQLFDVATLATQGYGDNVRKTTPLIIQHSRGKPLAGLPTGVTNRRELPSVNATAVLQDKKSGTALWAWLTGSVRSLPGQRSTVGGAYASAVRTVWLDGGMVAALDRSTTAAGVVARTPVSIYVEPEAYDITLEIIDRNGDRVTGYEQGQLLEELNLFNLDGIGSLVTLKPEGGKWVARTPPGAYTIALELLTPTASGPPSMTLYSVPRISADRPIALKLDARRANRATAVVEAAGARTTEISTTLVQQVGDSSLWTGATFQDPAVEPEAYVIPTEPTSRQYLFTLHQTLQAAEVSYNLVFAHQGALPEDPTYPVSDSQLADVTLIFGSQGYRSEVDYDHNATTNSDQVPIWISSRRTFGLPARQRHLLSTSVLGLPLIWDSYAAVYTETQTHAYSESVSEGEYWAGQRATLELSTPAFGPQGCGTHASDGSLWIDLGPFNSSGGGQIYRYDYPTPGLGTLDVWRDGVRILSSPDPYYAFVPQTSGTATYTAVMHAGGLSHWSGFLPEVSGTWTFTSTVPESGERPVPLISTRISGPFDGWGRAPAGRVFPLKLHITGNASEISSAVVRVSYNDGKSWVTVPVSNATGEWIASVRHPPTIGPKWVSLQVVVTDSEGNTGGWTAQRSYKLANLR